MSPLDPLTVRCLRRRFLTLGTPFTLVTMVTLVTMGSLLLPSPAGASAPLPHPGVRGSSVVVVRAVAAGSLHATTGAPSSTGSGRQVPAAPDRVEPAAHATETPPGAPAVAGMLGVLVLLALLALLVVSANVAGMLLAGGARPRRSTSRFPARPVGLP